MILDLLIVFFGIIALFRGRDIGFVRQALSTIGFFGGLFIGAALEPYTVQLVQGATNRSIVTVITTIGMALILLTIGEYVGIRIKHRVILAKLANTYDNAFGAVLGVASLLFSIWLTASVLASLPYPSIQNEIKRSSIIHQLDSKLPSAPSIIANLGRLVDPNGFPQVFIGSEPIPRGDISLPSLGDLEAAVNKDKDSVVKIAGTGCGGIVEGSGFVIAEGAVATNAHVVAGIKHP
ncbi:MAG: CvpA family protein, partial [Candidatus Saccharimonadales bacterium]